MPTEKSFPECSIQDSDPMQVRILGQTQSIPVSLAQSNLGEDAVYGAASVPITAWGTVLAFTPTEDKIVSAFNADVGSILAQNFRVRIRIGGMVKISEALSSTNMGVIRCALRVPAGVAVDVQVMHGEATAQTYEASIAYRKAV